MASDAQYTDDVNTILEECVYLAGDSVPSGYWEALGRAIDALPKLQDSDIEIEPFYMSKS